MRAREPDTAGSVERDGLRIAYEVHGDGDPTILLLPTWTIIHSRFWKLQVPYLARHHRVVTYDGPGNGGSDRPLDPAAYAPERQVAYALAVLDATGTDRAVVVGLSRAAGWALELAADHADRVLGTVVIGGALPLGRPAAARAAYVDIEGPAPQLPPSNVPRVARDPDEHWTKYNHDYWQQEWEDFRWFFFGQCFSEPHSTKPIEDAVGWSGETTGELVVAETMTTRTSRQVLKDRCARIESPVLVIHGSDDRVIPLSVGEELADLTGAELVVLEGAGHIPMGRDPVEVDRLLHGFAERFRPGPPPRRTWSRWDAGRRKALYICSPIGLGHARRDVAIARELRRRHPDLQIDWLAQHPVTQALEAAGERVHPASRWLANESAHIEDESGEHDLHCFEALRRMDEILLANFMVFSDVVEGEPYDLVIGDEAWEVDHFLHENPRLKRVPYAWLTDFVGYLPMPDGGEREALVTADYNAEMIEHIARHPRIRDRAVFVGDPDDIVPDRFGPELPLIREWTEAHYDFAGYVTGFDPVSPDEREALRAELGYEPGEPVCVVTVGGSGVGGDLLRRVADAFPEAARRVPGLRMVVVTGPRIDPTSLPSRPGLEVRSYVPDLHRHLAASDLAVVQGGLTTCMELTASRRPFLAVPLRHHFEQQFHVAHRLRRYGAGRQLPYDACTPDGLADAIATELGREVDYRPVPTDGAARAAALLAELL